MNTFLSESDQSVKVQFDHFASEQLAPVAQALESRQGNLGYFLQKIAQAGFLEITVPEEYGGRGGPFLHAILLAETLGFYDPGMGLSLAAQMTVIELIKRFGTDSQKAKYLPLLAQGELLGTFAYLELQDQKAFIGITTEVKISSSGRAIHGKKILVVNARLSNLMIVLAGEPIELQSGEGAEQSADGSEPRAARSCPPASGEGAEQAKDEARGAYIKKSSSQSLWLVDASAHHAIQVNDQGPYLGLRSAYLDEVNFNKCSISPEDRLGAEQGDPEKLNAQCQDQLEYGLSITKTVLAAAAVGLVEGLLAKSASHAQSKQSSGVPLGQSQAVQWRLADLAVASSAARLLTYRAAWSKEHSEEEFVKYAAMCKNFAAQAASVHSSEALQIMGLLANNSQSEFERFYRDAKMLELCEGTNDEQKVLIGRELGI